MTEKTNQRRKRTHRAVKEGDRFGMLVVLSFAYRDPFIYFLCRCDCGTEKPIRKSSLYTGAVVSCGCFHSPPLETRFWSYVDKTPGQGPKGECWEWTGGRNKKGYGKFQRANKCVAASHVAYEIQVGPIPDGLQVLHHCDNPPCVRGEHLFSGTNDDNVADKMAKGRYRCLSGDAHPNRLRPERLARGEENGWSKGSDEEIREIRRLYAQGGVSQRQLGRKFNRSQVSIGQIVRLETRADA